MAIEFADWLIRMSNCAAPYSSGCPHRGPERYVRAKPALPRDHSFLLAAPKPPFAENVLSAPGRPGNCTMTRLLIWIPVLLWAGLSVVSAVDIDAVARIFHAMSLD
jgi:hypothetical protein